MPGPDYLASPSGAPADEFLTWQSDVASFAAVDRLDPPPAGVLLFLGSSSIRLWHTLAADFPERPTLNRGFGGSQVSDLVYFADRLVAPYQPGAVLLYAGGNDLAAGKRPERLRGEFARFVGLARHWIGPAVPFAYLSIKPNLARCEQLPQIRRANALIAECAAGIGVDFLDVHTPLLAADGQADRRWFDADGLHLNAAGYARWTVVLRAWLAGRGLL